MQNITTFNLEETNDKYIITIKCDTNSRLAYKINKTKMKFICEMFNIPYEYNWSIIANNTIWILKPFN